MYRAEFTLEAVTPIFMRGADQTKAEIRAASIKGLMRWWFRALAGSYFGDDIAGLRKAEEYVFGSTKQRSKVVVEVESPEPRKFGYECRIETKFDRRREIYTLRPKINPKMKVSSSLADPPNYLFFSINMLIDEVARKTLENVLAERGIYNKFRSKNQMREVLNRRGLSLEDINEILRERLNKNVLEYYPPNTKFSLRIKSFGDREFKIALLSLWTSVVLGGFGFRSRRGAGSLAFAGGDLDVLENLGLTTTFKKPEDLGSSIRRAVELTGNTLRREAVECIPPYPTLSEKSCCVALWNSGGRDILDVLKLFEQRYLGFRRSINKPERVVFGLPVNLGGKGVEEIKDELRELKNARRASPMIVGVLKINGNPFLRIVKFRTSTFHRNENIDKIARWEALAKFDDALPETVVYGSKSIFTEV